jgi:hypothetical protein
MSPTPPPDNAQPDHHETKPRPDAGYFTEVLVYAGVLHAAAETLELLHDFFTSADQTVRLHLGRFLTSCHLDEDTADPATEANILLSELTEAADLLHTLASR